VFNPQQCQTEKKKVQHQSSSLLLPPPCTISFRKFHCTYNPRMGVVVQFNLDCQLDWIGRWVKTPLDMSERTIPEIITMWDSNWGERLFWNVSSTILGCGPGRNKHGKTRQPGILQLSTPGAMRWATLFLSGPLPCCVPHHGPETRQPTDHGLKPWAKVNLASWDCFS
jgi:hypothetical protein